MADVSARTLQAEMAELEKVIRPMQALSTSTADAAISGADVAILGQFCANIDGFWKRFARLSALISEAAQHLTGSTPDTSLFKGLCIDDLDELHIDDSDDSQHDPFIELNDWFCQAKIYLERLVVMEDRRDAEATRPIRAGGDVLIINGTEVVITTHGSTTINKSSVINALNTINSASGADAMKAFADAVRIVNDSKDDMAIAAMEKLANELNKPDSEKDKEGAKRLWERLTSTVSNLADVASKVAPLFS
jgi:hypothetical protein